MPQTFTPWKAISTPLHKIKKKQEKLHRCGSSLCRLWVGSQVTSLSRSPFVGRWPATLFSVSGTCCLYSPLLRSSHSTSLPVISVQTEPSSFCSLVLLYLCHFATFAQRVELSSSWGSGLWMYPNTVPMRLGPHADELASQDTSFVQFEAQKKALEISAALRDLRQVDIRS